MIIKGNVVHDEGSSFGDGSELLEVNHLSFKSMEERLHEGVVPTVTFSAHAQGDSVAENIFPINPSMYIQSPDLNER